MHWIFTSQIYYNEFIALENQWTPVSLLKSSEEGLTDEYSPADTLYDKIFYIKHSYYYPLLRFSRLPLRKTHAVYKFPTIFSRLPEGPWVLSVWINLLMDVLRPNKSAYDSMHHIIMFAVFSMHQFVQTTYTMSGQQDSDIFPVMFSDYLFMKSS